MRKGIGILCAIISIVCFSSVPYSSAASAPQKINIAIGQEPTSIDQSLVYLGADYFAVENWAEHLIEREANGDLKPGLVTSWKSDPSGKVIDFTLRKGVKFHSGDPLTTKDIEFTFERARAKNNTQRTRLSSVERIEVLDDYRFKIHFKDPDVLFIPLQGNPFIISKRYYDRVGEDKFSKQPVGTGPYKLVNYVPGEYLDIERYEDYWGPKPQVKEARFYFVSEDMTRVAKLKAGEADLISSVPYTSIKDLEKDPQFKLVKSVPGHPTPLIQFGTRNPKVPWTDRRVRMAMALAIDYDGIIKNLLLDIPKRYPVIAPYEIGYDPSVKPYPYDPKKAKELLAEAGYPNGFEFQFSWLVTGRAPMIRETVEALAGYFEAVGIRTKLLAEEAAAWNARRRAGKEPTAVYVGIDANGAMAGSVDPCHFMTAMLRSDGQFSVYSNPEYDKVIDEARATMDDAKRGELVKKAVKIVYDDAAFIPIYSSVPIFAMKKNVDFSPTRKFPFELIRVKHITVK
jgi:peptide/nickel transport system substrate-binding protein